MILYLILISLIINNMRNAKEEFLGMVGNDEVLCAEICYTNMGTIICMMIFGWIPSVIIACDLEDKLNKY